MPEKTRAPRLPARLAAAALIAAVVAIASAGCGSSAAPAPVEDRTPTNLETMRTLVAEIAAAVFDSAGRPAADTVLLSVDSSGADWLARTEIAGFLGRQRRVVLANAGSSDAGLRWRVSGLRAGSEYRDIRRPGLFSGAVVDRVVTVEMTSELAAGGRVLYAGAVGRTAIDTVAEDRVADLESGLPQGSGGDVPDMETLDRFVEPLVIIGAAGAAIFLFFQVRS